MAPVHGFIAAFLVKYFFLGSSPLQDHGVWLLSGITFCGVALVMGDLWSRLGFFRSWRLIFGLSDDETTIIVFIGGQFADAGLALLLSSGGAGSGWTFS